MKYCFLPLLLVASFLPAFAQGNSVDQAISRYEAICNECIELKEKALAGETIPQGAFTELLGKLSELRLLLSGTKEKMTRSQKLRLESIRLRYDEAFSSETPTRTPDKPLPQVSSKPLAPPTQVLPLGCSPALSGTGESMSPPMLPKQRPLSVLATGEFPRGFAGIFLSYSPGRFGAFVKGTIFPCFQSYSYDCLSDGTVPAGGYIWTTGEERQTGYSLTTGGTFALTGKLSAYVGGGYGVRRILWEDTSGSWAKVSDKGASVVAADAGFIFPVGRFRFMAGASTIALKDFSVQLGVGISFPTLNP